MIFKSTKCILASNSPRRKDILSEIFCEFKTISIDFNEHFNEYHKKLAQELALNKLNQIDLQLKQDELLVCADTIVVYKKQVLGKPSNKDEAFKYLNLLSGNSHDVLTGVAFKKNNSIYSFQEKTAVNFNKIDENLIDFYLKNYKPYDKAGAYGIQEWIGKVAVKEINGCFYNVMGFPLSRFIQEYKKYDHI